MQETCSNLDSLVVALAALVLSIITFWRQHRTANQERIHTVCARLFDVSSQLVAYPEIQERIYSEASRATDFFCKTTPHDATYFRVKTHIYEELNLFDEIMVIVSKDSLLNQDFEIEAWREYIIGKMRHPLYRELFRREGHIWGPRFQEFCREYCTSINKPCDPEMF